MNQFINFLERKFGKYAIPRLPMYMLICYAAGYLMEFINSDIVYFLSLNPYAIMHGQVWRLVTWVLIPPDGGNLGFFQLFLTAVMLYFYYSIGTVLERTWGTFYFNYYIFSGILFTILGAFALTGFSMLVMPESINIFNEGMTWKMGQECSWVMGGNYYFLYQSLYFSTYYINMTTFLAFAATYPDMTVNLYFIIPLKVKYLAIFYGIFIVISAFSSGWLGLFVCFVSMLNFLLFFFTVWKTRHRSIKTIRRQREFRRKTENVYGNGNTKIAKHKCAICGRTSESHPELEFRFCSKCEGNYEFCQDHLFTHKHFTRSNNQNQS